VFSELLLENDNTFFELFLALLSAVEKSQHQMLEGTCECGLMAVLYESF
jgi:hypothetical protein